MARSNIPFPRNKIRALGYLFASTLICAGSVMLLFRPNIDWEGPLIPVRDATTWKIGFIDGNGELAIPFTWGWAVAFGSEFQWPSSEQGVTNPEGLAAFWTVERFDPDLPGNHKDVKVGLIDRRGKLVGTEWNGIVNFDSAGMAVVIRDDRIGYIDQTGELVIPLSDPIPGWLGTSPFRFNSVGVAPRYFGDEGMWGFINRNGDVVAGQKWAQLPKRCGSYWCVTETPVTKKKDSRYGLLSTDAQSIVLEPTFTYISEGVGPGEPLGLGFGDGLRCGFFDQSTGTVVTKREWERVWRFSEGLASVSIGGLYGVVDTNGEVVVEPRWRTVKKFVNGHAEIREASGKGLISRTGKVVASPDWDEISDMSELGYAQVSLGTEKFGLIDRTGNLVLPTTFAPYGPKPTGAGVAVVRTLNKGYGVIKLSGEVVIPVENYSIHPHGEHFIVRKNSEAVFYSAEGKLLFRTGCGRVHCQTVTDRGRTFEVVSAKVPASGIQKLKNEVIDTFREHLGMPRIVRYPLMRTWVFDGDVAGKLLWSNAWMTRKDKGAVTIFFGCVHALLTWRFPSLRSWNCANSTKANPIT